MAQINPNPNISTNNNIETNFQTELVALRAAQMAPYFTVGSKGYFGDQLVGKRNGQTYGFVIRDAGECVNDIDASHDSKTAVVERRINMSIEPWHILVKTNAVEGKTDMQFDKEVAEPNGLKLINGALKKSIASDISKAATCFVGQKGQFEPLSMASGHLASVTSEALYGFVDPMVEAIVTSKGAQFVPVNAPDMYKQGLVGHFHGADYRSQRFLPQIKISKTLGDALEGAKFASFNASTNTLTITLGSNAAAATKVQAGTPFFVDGIVACDLIGDETAQPYAFIAAEDVNVASGAATIAVKVDEVPVALGGTRVAALEDGSEVVWADLGTPDVYAPAEGVYFTGLIRANGTYEFETLNELDVATVDTKKGSVEGINIFQNRLVDLVTMVNDTRFDLFTLSGTVEKRGVSLILIKAN